jgi:hypothetical protein
MQLSVEPNEDAEDRRAKSKNRFAMMQSTVSEQI